MKLSALLSMLSIAIAASSATTAQALSNRHTFNCVTDKVIEGRKPTTVRFAVENLDSGTPKLIEGRAEEDYMPFTMVPEFSAMGLNDNTGFDVQKDRVEISADGDGCSLTSFVLYRNADFKKGYVAVKAIGGCGGDNLYSTVTCRINRQ
jgi:hypothetical protein